MINNDTPQSVYFDDTVHARFGVECFAATLVYGVWRSPTPLEQLLEDSGSLPASKCVSGT